MSRPFLYAFGWLLLLPSQLSAEPLLPLGGNTVGVEASRLEVDVPAGSAVLTGNVTLTKGDLKVSCPRIEVRFDGAPHLNWARGSGGVVADVRGVHVEAPEFEFDVTKQLLEMRGGVKLSRSGGWIQAERATIELATMRVNAREVKGSIPVPQPKGQ